MLGLCQSLCCGLRHCLECTFWHVFISIRCSAKIHNIYYKAKKKDGKKMFASFLCVFSHKISVGQCKKTRCRCLHPAISYIVSLHSASSASAFCLSAPYDIAPT